MKLIVFDLDHTLLVANSSFRFGIFLYQQKIFSFWTLLGCLHDYARHKWLGMSVQTLHARTFSRLFKGACSKEIRRHVDQFLTAELTSMLYAPVIQRLQAAQARGDLVLILSSSPDFLVEAIAERLQVPQWEATRYQIDKEGKFAAITSVMEGENKAHYVQGLVAQLPISLSNVTVYSDSHLDVPLLQLAGQAVGVRPDHRLRRICEQNGWEIL